MIPTEKSVKAKLRIPAVVDTFSVFILGNTTNTSRFRVISSDVTDHIDTSWAGWGYNLPDTVLYPSCTVGIIPFGIMIFHYLVI